MVDGISAKKPEDPLVVQSIVQSYQEVIGRGAWGPGAPAPPGRGPFPETGRQAGSLFVAPAGAASAPAARPGSKPAPQPAPPTTKPVPPLRRSRTISTSPGKRPSTLLREEPIPVEPRGRGRGGFGKAGLRPAARRRRPRSPDAPTVKTSAPSPQARRRVSSVRSKRPKNGASRKSAAWAGGSRTRPEVEKQFIRVNIERLDNLMNLVGGWW